MLLEVALLSTFNGYGVKKTEVFKDHSHKENHPITIAGSKSRESRVCLGVNCCVDHSFLRLFFLDIFKKSL